MRKTVRFSLATIAAFISATASSLADPQADKAAWTAAVASHLSQQDKWEDLEYLREVANQRKNRPNDNIPFSYKDMLYQRLRAEDSLSGGDALAPKNSEVPSIWRANQIYEALKQEGASGYLLGSYLQDRVGDLTRSTALDAFMITNRSQFETFSNNVSRLSDTLSDVYDLAKSDPAFKDAVNEIYGREFGAFVGESAKDILASNPDLAANKFIMEAIDSQGNAIADVNNLEKDLLGAIAKQGDKIDAVTREMATKDDAEDTQETVEKMNAKILQEAEAQRQSFLDSYDLSGIRTGAYVVSSLMSDKNAGRLLNITINSSVDLYQSIYAYQKAVALRESKDALNADEEYNDSTYMNEAVLTFNLVAIGMRFADSIGGDHPNPDALILEQIAKLSEQINDFQKNVNGRFDEVDDGLNLIYAEMGRNFNEVLHVLQGIQADVSGVRRSIERGAIALDFDSDELKSGIGYLVDLDFKTSMSKCLNYKRDSGTMLPRSLYLDCISRIRAYLDQARDPINSGAWINSYSDPMNLSKALRSGDWGGNVNLIRDIIQINGGTAFDSRRANPKRWLLASQLYIKLISEDPDDFSRLPPELLSSLLAEGRAYVEELNIQACLNPKPLLQAYAKLVEQYNAALKTFDTQAAFVRHKALEEAGSELADAGVRPSGASDENVAIPAAIAMRPIPHVAANNADYVKIPDDPSWAQASPVGAQNWPVIKNPGAIWHIALSVPDLVDAEALGLGKLDLEYGIYVQNRKPYDYGGALWQVYATPRIRYFLYLVSPNGARTLLATAATVGTPEVKTEATIHGGSAYPMMGVQNYVDLVQFIESNDLPFGQVSEFQSVDTTLSSDLDKQRDVLRNHMHIALEREMASPTSDLSNAANTLDAIIYSLRGITALSLPGASENDIALRSLLFGAPNPTANTIGTNRQKNYSFLLTSSNIKSILDERDREAATNNKSVPNPEWRSPDLLEAFEEPQVQAVSRLMAHVAMGLDNSARNHDVQPTIGRTLGDLQMISRARADHLPIGTGE